MCLFVYDQLVSIATVSNQFCYPSFPKASMEVVEESFNGRFQKFENLHHSGRRTNSKSNQSGQCVEHHSHLPSIPSKGVHLHVEGEVYGDLLI